MRSGLPGTIACLLLVMGCSTAPPRVPLPAAVESPPALLRLRDFFASAESTFGYRVSPDGTRLGWIGSHRGRNTVHVRTLGGDDVRPIDSHSRRTIWSFTWARDSRRLFYLLDEAGDENHHVYLASSDRPDAAPVDLTPVRGSRAWVHRVPRNDPGHVVIAWNRRDRAMFDLYHVSLDTGAATLVAENPGDVIEWMTDWEGQPRARIRHVGPKSAGSRCSAKAAGSRASASISRSSTRPCWA